ncbi:hypothetical protein JKI95_09190 [Corynebacterium aquatimens]|uniref:hypothetical protein n=1 Tax=Corynebacterium aquatimens TaxID=1190508 RepID=UPI0025404D83|nr:hypothetical protein [Corynebacterium aquatimens]QYH19309.1 hypothetical protein JKI95_09190 [Corynebacterium aquatimens]
MLFIPTIEKRGDTAAVFLDEPRIFAEGIDLDAARAIADALNDRFEIYSIANEPGYLVLIYDNQELIKSEKVETWVAALDTVVEHAADLAPEGSAEESEGAEDSKIPASGDRSTFGAEPLEHAPVKSSTSCTPADSLRYLHLDSLLNEGLTKLDELLKDGNLAPHERRNLRTVRSTISNARALIRDEYGSDRSDGEDPAVYSNGVPVTTELPHTAGGTRHSTPSKVPRQRINHPSAVSRPLTRSSAVDRSFDGLEDGYVA